MSCHDSDDTSMSSDGVRLGTDRKQRFTRAIENGTAEGMGLFDFRRPVPRGELAEDILGNSRRSSRRTNLGNGDVSGLIPGGHPQDKIAQG